MSRDQNSFIWKWTFRGTKLSLSRHFAASFAGHLHTWFMISGIMLATLCFQDIGHRLCWKHFLLLLLSPNYRGSSARIYAGFPENGYLDDMCYVNLSRKLIFPSMNAIAELSRTHKYTCNGHFYINPLQGPLDRCSHLHGGSCDQQTGVLQILVCTILKSTGSQASHKTILGPAEIKRIFRALFVDIRSDQLIQASKQRTHLESPCKGPFEA